ncbi:RHS repeat-associated core domain-containing protein [Nocardiopsis sp. HUAS JQ3]|uniref:RHS repeat-associated core domain-containing protein n=1 Tax=Nocardiopsis sp. HUAS JQ3 TaxID=3061629 RepID=UPI0023AA05D5|nr:RHS repeat-associated core domain-containing protein [Nocardiopsis sp. HUAS JQ3]WDZ90200.1 hypothetical protein PV789_25425 [Nocardiopsis sp. HUAS JQ3]
MTVQPEDFLFRVRAGQFGVGINVLRTKHTENVFREFPEVFRGEYTAHRPERKCDSVGTNRVRTSQALRIIAGCCPQATSVGAGSEAGAYRFQGGTVHLNHRFHSTFTLGFTQPDPSRQELNNYAYAACDPINNTDPTGLCTASAVDFVFGFASYVGAAYTLSGMAAGTIAVAAGPVTWAVATGVMAVWGVSRGIQAMNQNC